MTAAVLRADARNLPLPDGSVDLVCTSPPFYALRDYRDGGASLAGQIGAERTPQAYVDALLDATREWVRVLKPGGSIFCNLGDKFSGAQAQSDGRAARSNSADFWRRTDPRRTGIPNKSLMLLPERYRVACVDQLGLIARAVVIWAKPNGLPESVTDRVRRSHEDFVHLVKQPRYYSAVDEIRQPHTRVDPPRRLGTRNQTQRHTAATDNTGWKDNAVAHHPLGALPGSVWEVASQPFSPPVHVAHARCCGGQDKTCERGLAHYAAFPPALVRRIVLGWSPPGICTECGEGRRPVATVEDRSAYRDLSLTPSQVGLHAEGAWHDGIETSTLARPGWRKTGRPQHSITGYACACPTPDAPTRPSFVVDPFGGTGTVAMVASVLGRRGLSFDLSHDYGRLARWRTADPRERARAAGVTPPPPVSPAQSGLFELEAG
jgi:DNA modification methylase